MKVREQVRRDPLRFMLFGIWGWRPSWGITEQPDCPTCWRPMVRDELHPEWHCWRCRPEGPRSGEEAG